MLDTESSATRRCEDRMASRSATDDGRLAVYTVYMVDGLQFTVTFDFAVVAEGVDVGTYDQHLTSIGDLRACMEQQLRSFHHL